MPPTINQFFDAIPQAAPDLSPLLTGLIGAIAALAGVLLSNRSNAKRLDKQLFHDEQLRKLQLEADSFQKGQDRLAALRKEVYLQIPRQTAHVIQFLGNLSQTDLREISKLNPIGEFGAVAAQASVLSDVPTGRALNRLGVAFAETFMQELVALDSLQDVRSDIQLREARQHVVLEDINRIQRQQQLDSERGNISREEREGQNFWLSNRLKEYEELSTQLSDLRARQQRLIFEYHHDQFPRTARIMELNIEVMKCVRAELGLEHDLEAYEAEMRDSRDRLGTAMLQLMERWAKAAEAE